MIVIEDLCKVYHGGLGADTVALDGVSLTIEDGEFVAIMGPSGSGKSTLMNMLGCLDTPTSGTYLLDGEDVATLDDDSLADIRNLRIGFVFQSFNLLPRATAMRNVLVPLLYSTVAEVRAAETRRRQRSTRPACPRSSGTTSPTSSPAARCSASRSHGRWSTDPGLILADEPTGNLDTKTGEVILGAFQRLNDEGRTIVLITHEPHIAEHCQAHRARPGRQDPLRRAGRRSRGSWEVIADAVR